MGLTLAWGVLVGAGRLGECVWIHARGVSVSRVALQGCWRQVDHMVVVSSDARCRPRPLPLQASALTLAIGLHQGLRIGGLTGHHNQGEYGEQIRQHKVDLIRQRTVTRLLQPQLQCVKNRK